jgi:hypothetical protein
MDGRSAFALWADAGAAVETLLRTVRQTAAKADAPDDGAAALLTEAYLIAVSSGLRCVGQLAARCEHRRDALAAFISGDKGAEAAAELRALAGELGETAVAEAQRFRGELLELADRISPKKGC